jgi:NitT/TauT family transport system substrate-binding protein
VASIKKHSGNSSTSLAEYSYDFFNPLWAKDPRVDPKLIDQAFQLAADATGEKKPANTRQYIDNSFLDELRRSGYLASLYR